MDDYAANRWAKAAIEAWLAAAPKRTLVRLAEEMNARIPGAHRTKQYINKIKRVPEDGGAKPQKLKPEDIQALAEITGTPEPILVQSLPPGGGRDMLRRAIVLVRALGDDVLRRAGIEKEEWDEIADGARPFSRALALHLSEAAGEPADFILDGDWDCLSVAASRKMAKLATQVIPI